MVTELGFPVAMATITAGNAQAAESAELQQQGGHSCHTCQRQDGGQGDPATEAMEVVGGTAFPEHDRWAAAQCSLIHTTPRNQHPDKQSRV